MDLRYSGYSSIHYQAELGENSGAADLFKGFQIEFQLRTILEEAWGEIDHKYRYMFSRKGEALPEHIHTGFYNLSVYLQAAALHAEYLCRQAETHRLSKIRKTIVKVVDEDIQPKFSSVFKEIFGFKPTARTSTYVLKRFNESGYKEQPQHVFHKIFTKERRIIFETIFREILNRDAFENNSKRNVDAINAVNFVLSIEIQGERVTQEGLKSVLRMKKKR